MDIPDFLVLGGMRCGTTSIYEWLREHPQIALPPNKKGVYYFSRHYDKGLQWYSDFFKNARGKCKGEVTSYYLYSDKCPQRIFKTKPDVKLIVILRNPVERAYSEFKFHIKENGQFQAFDMFLSQKPEATIKGLYYKHISKYLEYFPKEQFQIIIFEEMISHPKASIRQIFNFLGVDADFTPNSLEKRANPGQLPRFDKLYRFSKKVSNKLHRHNLSRFVEMIKHLKIGGVFFAGKINDSKFPPMSKNAYKWLCNYYLQDVKELSDLLDRDMLQIWMIHKHIKSP